VLFYIYIHIYIYIERERERERAGTESSFDISTCDSYKKSWICSRKRNGCKSVKDPDSIRVISRCDLLPEANFCREARSKAQRRTAVCRKVPEEGGVKTQITKFLNGFVNLTINE
jgi:hypothetical protein